MRLEIFFLLLATVFGHNQTTVSKAVKKFQDEKNQVFNPEVFTFRSADRAMIEISLDDVKENMWINATVPYNHYLMLYFLGYSDPAKEAPKLFSDRVSDPNSPDYEKGMTRVLVWQSDDDWSLCGEAVHVEGAETPVMDRYSRIDCRIMRDDPTIPPFYSKFVLKRPIEFLPNLTDVELEAIKNETETQEI